MARGGEFMVQQMQVGELGSAAVGTIGPAQRIASGELTNDEVDTFAAAVANGEFDTAVSQELGPCAAGGTFTLVIADALTHGRFTQPGDKAADHAKRMYAWLQSYADSPDNRLIIPRQCVDGRGVAEDSKPSPYIIGDHDSDHGTDDCGAQKRLGDILGYVADNADTLRAVAEREGVFVDDVTHVMIASNARLLLDAGYVSTGNELRAAYTEVAGEESIARLEGHHNEVVARKNRNPQITLDREAIKARRGLGLQSFEVDAGVFPAAANVIALDEQSAHQLVVAMEYYNTATALVLSEPSLRYAA